MVLALCIFVALILWAILDTPFRKLLDRIFNKQELCRLTDYFQEFQEFQFNKVNDESENFKSRKEDLKDWALKDIELSNKIEQTEQTLKFAYWVKDKAKFRGEIENLKNELSQLRKENLLKSICSIHDFSALKFKTSTSIYSSDSARREHLKDRLEYLNTYKIFSPNNVLFKE